MVASGGGYGEEGSIPWSLEDQFVGNSLAVAVDRRGKDLDEPPALPGVFLDRGAVIHRGSPRPEPAVQRDGQEFVFKHGVSGHWGFAGVEVSRLESFSVTHGFTKNSFSVLML